MSTAAPLPRLAALMAAAFAAVPDGDALAMPWQSAAAGPRHAQWFSRSAFALAALAAARQGEGKYRPLWLPDYFCNQSSGPSRLAGAPILHYPITADLAPDWPACHKLATKRPPDLFLLVHYFGRPADGTAARAFCDSFGATLVEDAAHVLVPKDGIGSHGDAVFYSPHKLFALPDGALLLTRGSQAVAPSPMAAPPAWPWLVRRLLQKAMPAPLHAAAIRRRLPNFDRDPPFAALPATPVPSRLALRLLARVDPAGEAAARRRNAEFWAAALAGRPDIRPFPSPIPDAPYRFVAEAVGETAADLFETFRARGCPVESWPDLAPEVLADPFRHAVAIRLRRRLLFLPVHSGVTPYDIRRWTA